MSALGHVGFNLIANSVFTFVFTLALIMPVRRWLARRPGDALLWLLVGPFAKVVWDLVQGVPPSSFLWAKLAGQTQDLGSFRFGVGVADWLPRLKFTLAAFSRGLIYPQSAGDVLDSGLSKHLSPFAPGAIALSVVAVSCMCLALRGLRTRAFLTAACRDARMIGSYGRIEVLRSERHMGVPFAYGLLHPRVVFSACVYEALGATEREAALQHELAHVRHGDLWLLSVLAVVSDVFWFLPGRRGVLDQIHAVLEQRADEAALAAGVERAALASALVRVGELLHASGRLPASSAAMASRTSLLTERVQRVLGAAQPFGRGARTWQSFVVVVLLVVVAEASFLGNHSEALIRFPIP